jgi:polyisoprenoid-binding protein YceI
MKRLLLVGATVLAIVVAYVAYSFFKTPEEASAPIAAIPLVRSTSTAAPRAVTATPSGEAAATPVEGEPASSGAGAEPVLFEISQDESEARFIINETLRGAPKAVVGRTNQVAGQVLINPADPTQSQVGVIQVNARTLATDSDMRNRTIKNRILLTDAHEFVTFTPRQLLGLPATGAVGKPYTFQMVGDLTITDVTREATFEVTVTAASETRIEGLASTTILYKDFRLAIPDAPAVDEVEDDVRLELQFVATPVA